MQLIRCTKKLQKILGLKIGELFEQNIEDSILGPWHANLIYIDRKKCILFVNDKTLFNFIIPDVNKSQFKELSSLFKMHLACVLSDLGVPEIAKVKIMSEYDTIQFANTNNKSVLGSMNDLAYHYKHHILYEGGVQSPAVPNIIKKLNHMPMGALEYKFSIEALKLVYVSET